jgi:hypothetical protein
LAFPIPAPPLLGRAALLAYHLSSTPLHQCFVVKDPGQHETMKKLNETSTHFSGDIRPSDARSGPVKELFHSSNTSKLSRGFKNWNNTGF